MTKPAHRSTQL